jgi:hypothetical protein
VCACVITNESAHLAISTRAKLLLYIPSPFTILLKALISTRSALFFHSAIFRFSSGTAVSFGLIRTAAPIAADLPRHHTCYFFVQEETLDSRSSWRSTKSLIKKPYYNSDSTTLQYKADHSPNHSGLPHRQYTSLRPYSSTMWLSLPPGVAKFPSLPPTQQGTRQ